MAATGDRSAAGWEDRWGQVAAATVRGPLARIIGGLDSLSRDKALASSEQPRRIISSSLSACRRLTTMLDGLVEIQQDSGKPVGSWRQAVPLVMTLDPELHSLEAMAKIERKSFIWNPPDQFVTVDAEGNVFRRAFLVAAERMLDDAPPGSGIRASTIVSGGTVRMRLSAPAAGGETFTSPANSAELAFVKMAIEFMGGRCLFHSSPEFGTTVEMELPLAGTPPLAPAAAEPVAGPPAAPVPATQHAEPAPAVPTAEPRSEPGPEAPPDQPGSGGMIIRLSPSLRRPDAGAKPAPPKESPQGAPPIVNVDRSERVPEDQSIGGIKIIRSPTYDADK